MNKLIATKLANQKLDEVINSEDRQRHLSLLKESEYSLINYEGKDYQLRVHALQEDKKNEIIRIMVAIDDLGFWSTFIPLCVSSFVDKNANPVFWDEKKSNLVCKIISDKQE